MIKPYDKYKESGIEWIGQIPKEWSQTQLKYISSISKGRKAKDDYQDFKEGMIPYLSMEYLRNQTESPSYVFADDSSIVLVDEKDLLILWDGSKAGEIVKAKKGALSSTMGKIHVESDLYDLNFLSYYLKNAERFIQSNTVGMGIPHVSGEVLRTLFITFPNRNEQTTIANYLDHQTVIIDQLIQQKEKLIAMLKEKRQAVINEAVTKGLPAEAAAKAGLNPNAKMKDSGIEWLGEVPEDWLLTKMKFGCQFIFDGTHGSFSRVDEGYRLLSVRNIIDSKFTFRDDDSRISEKDYLEISSKFEIVEDDIQLAIVGATLGKVAIVEKMSEPFVTQRSLATIRANSKKMFA
jgi:type I restriction enzyme S subunit